MIATKITISLRCWRNKTDLDGILVRQNGFKRWRQVVGKKVVSIPGVSGDLINVLCFFTKLANKLGIPSLLQPVPAIMKPPYLEGTIQSRGHARWYKLSRTVAEAGG